MIKIFAVGNIGKDATVRQISDKANIVEFSIASSEKVKDEKVTTWLTCKKWNAEKLAQYLVKGTKVAVSGNLEIREHDGKYYTSCVVDNIEFVGSAGKATDAPANNDVPDEDLPF